MSRVAALIIALVIGHSAQAQGLEGLCPDSLAAGARAFEGSNPRDLVGTYWLIMIPTFHVMAEPVESTLTLWWEPLYEPARIDSAFINGYPLVGFMKGDCEAAALACPSDLESTDPERPGLRYDPSERMLRLSGDVAGAMGFDLPMFDFSITYVTPTGFIGDWASSFGNLQIEMADGALVREAVGRFCAIRVAGERR